LNRRRLIPNSIMISSLGGPPYGTHFSAKANSSCASRLIRCEPFVRRVLGGLLCSRRLNSARASPSEVICLRGLEVPVLRRNRYSGMFFLGMERATSIGNWGRTTGSVEDSAPAATVDNRSITQDLSNTADGSPLWVWAYHSTSTSGSSPVRWCARSSRDSSSSGYAVNAGVTSSVGSVTV